MPSFARLDNMTRWLYTLLLHLLLPLVLLRLYWRGRRAPGYSANIGQRFGRHTGFAPGGIVLHAVSLGETLAAQPLVNALLKDYPDRPLTITNTTATGAERARALWAGKAGQCFLPYDFPWAVSAFLDRLQPRLFIIMETELWPNLMAELARRRIPVLLANARLSERSARGYARIAGLVTPMLRSLTVLAAQDEATAARFRQLGLPETRLSITGSLKFDLSLPPDLSQRTADWRRQWSLEGRRIWIAASTHEGEEEAALAAYRRLLAEFPSQLLILAPRHPERFDRIAELLRKQGLRYVRRSLQQPVSPDTQVFLADSVGELLQWYALADIAFVGGSLVGVGGHNPLEPAALAKPVLTGPHMFNFQQITETLAAAGALRQVADTAALTEAVRNALAHPAEASAAGAAGAAVMAASRGALSRHMALVSVLLSGAEKT